MRKGPVIALFAVSLLLLTLSAASADAADDDVNYGYFIEGYVAVADADRMPLMGVTVSVMDKAGAVLSEGGTNIDGLFSVGVPVGTPTSDLQISFAAFGYTVLKGSNTMAYQEGSDNLALKLSADIYNSSKRTYTVTGPIDGSMECVIMVASEGVVRGLVSFGATPVKNATVTLVPVNSEGTYVTHTGDSGQYEITCPTGTYTLTASGQGFNQSDSSPVSVSSNPSTVNVVLEKSEFKKYIGLDTAHVLMLVGVIVGIMLAVAAWFLSQRMNGPNRVEIIDDSALEDEDVPKHP